MKDLALLTDFYQLSMMQGYFFTKPDQTAVFDVFYRKNPSGGGYAIFCGLSEVVDYIENLKFFKQICSMYKIVQHDTLKQDKLSTIRLTCHNITKSYLER